MTLPSTGVFVSLGSPIVNLFFFMMRGDYYLLFKDISLIFDCT